MSNPKWEMNIGLEIHAQINTLSKLFSSDSTKFTSKENTSVHPVSLGFPGTLPVLNKKVVEAAIKVGKAFHCDIKKKSVFARKNYFYPDLPKGYQISQYNLPILENGYVEFPFQDKYHKVELERIHLEEDAGKLVHQDSYSLVDFNRAGMPLIEIVSRPYMKSPQEAAGYARMVRLILIYLNVSDGHLQEGSIRFDCNVSIKPYGSEGLGQKVEIKNLNSFKFIEKSVQYEFERQITALENNEKILQETRLYNHKKNETFAMRSKEEASDYRYFPEPDLPCLTLNQKIEDLKIELPVDKIRRYQENYNIPLSSAMTLTSDLNLILYFESSVQKTPHAQTLSKWIINEVLGYLKEQNLSTDKIALASEELAELVNLIEKKTLSSKMAKDLFPKMWQTGEHIHDLIKKSGLKRVDDDESLIILIDQVILQFPEQCEQYKKGKENLLKFLMGQVMKLSKGQADPEKTTELLKKKLSN